MQQKSASLQIRFLETVTETNTGDENGGMERRQVQGSRFKIPIIIRSVYPFMMHLSRKKHRYSTFFVAPEGILG